MKIELDTKKVSVLIDQAGTDTVFIHLNDGSAFPWLEDQDAFAKIETMKGNGITWCKAILGLKDGEFEIISKKTGKEREK